MEFNKLGNGLSSQTRDVYVLTLQWHLKALPCPTYSSGIFRFLQPPVYPELKTRHSVLDLVVACLDQTSMCHVVDMFSHMDFTKRAYIVSGLLDRQVRVRSSAWRV